MENIISHVISARGCWPAPHSSAHEQLPGDFSQAPIPTDNVGPRQIAKPRPWNRGEIGKFNNEGGTHEARSNCVRIARRRLPEVS